MEINLKYFYGSLFFSFYIIYLFGQHQIIIKNNYNKCFGSKCALLK